MSTIKCYWNLIRKLRKIGIHASRFTRANPQCNIQSWFTRKRSLKWNNFILYFRLIFFTYNHLLFACRPCMASPIQGHPIELNYTVSNLQNSRLVFESEETIDLNVSAQIESCSRDRKSSNNCCVCKRPPFGGISSIFVPRGCGEP